MDFKSILLAQKTGYIPRNHFDALFAKRIGGAILKDFPDLPASIVTVTDALAKPLDSLKVAITPVQSGSGDPSPDNIRPISGWTGCNVVVSPTIDAEDGTTYTITFPSEAGTVYGGTLDVTNGTLTVTMAEVDLGTLNWIKDATTFAYTFFYSSFADVISNNILCSAYKTAKTSEIFSSEDSVIRFVDNPTIRLRLKDSTKNNLTGVTFKAAMSGVQLVYELATPQIYQLTPTEVQMLLGTNNLWADTGEIIEGKYFAKR